MITIKLDFLSKMGIQAAQQYLPFLEKYCDEYEINTNKRLATFLANIALESQEFTHIEENLNYSAERLAVVWPTHFKSYDGSPNPKANFCAHNPVALGNFIYANRMGNGDEASGDGYRHRGLGLSQLTGKDNQSRCGDDLGIDLVTTPELLLQPEWAVASACWFWSDKGDAMENAADSGDIVTVRKLWNGGTNGLDKVQAYYEKLLVLLGA